MNNTINRRSLAKRCVTALLVLGLLSNLVGCEGDELVIEDRLRPVRFVTISDSDQSRRSTFPGVSQSARESRLSFKVAGTVADIPVQVGDSIAAGTVIAKLDPSAYELQLQQAQANVAQSRAASRNAKAAYERTRSLYANNNAALGDLDAARAASESAEAQQRSAGKSLELAQLNLSYTRLSVDIDCSVDSISVEINENVSSSSEVARVNCSDDIEVEVTVPESTVTGLKKGNSARLQFDALANRDFDGEIVEIGNGIGGVGSTFPVTVAVKESDRALRPGLAVAVSFSVANPDVASKDVLIPLSSLIKRTDGTYVFVVVPDDTEPTQGVVELREVSAGDLTSSGIQIIDGLSSGERVVTAGVSFLRDQQAVALP